TSWGFRIPHFIWSYGTTQTDLQVNLTQVPTALNTLALVSANKMNVNGSDDRWVSANDTTEISGFWNETAYNATDTTVWGNITKTFSSNLTEYSGTDNILNVSNATGFSNNDVVFIVDNRTADECSTWEVNTITNVSGNKLTFSTNFENNYSATTGAVTFGVWRYYNNPSASSARNITNTFLLGDDFDDGTIDANKWDTSSATGFSEGSGYLNQNGLNQFYIFSQKSFSTPVAVRTRVKGTTNPSISHAEAGFFSSTSDHIGYLTYDSN
ncbi:unnamed protein product, partial [marine sediment metagenome]